MGKKVDSYFMINCFTKVIVAFYRWNIAYVNTLLFNVLGHIGQPSL